MGGGGEVGGLGWEKVGRMGVSEMGRRKDGGEGEERVSERSEGLRRWRKRGKEE